CSNERRRDVPSRRPFDEGHDRRRALRYTARCPGEDGTCSSGDAHATSTTLPDLATSMTTLRILVDAMPDAGRAFAWALVDAGRVRQRGHAPPGEWPRAETTVAIVDAPLVHVAALVLPPIPGARLGDAVRYALDDQLAAAADTLHIVHGPQASDGRVVAVAASRALVDAIAARLPAGARIVALPALLPRAADWQWAIDDGGHGF